MNLRSSFAIALPLSLVAAACGSSSGTGGTGGQSAASSGDAASTTTSGSGGSVATSGSSHATTSASSGAGGGSSGNGRWVSGYYVGYQQNLYPPDAIDWNGLTHLMVGRVTPKPDGTLNTTFDLDAVSGPALAKNLVKLAHQNGRKAIVMLGGAGEHDGWVSASSAAHQAAFVQNLLKLAQDYGFDGFDFDWEPLDAADQPSFKALVEAVKAGSPSAILTVPVGWVSSNSPSVDAFYGQVAPLFDQINVMSYGMAGAWPGWQSWHSSAIHGEGATHPSSVDASVKAYLAAGVPAKKIGLGIAFYGSCWTSPVSAPLADLNGSQIAADDNVMSYAHIMSDYYSDANHHWDAAALAPYLGFASPHGAEKCTFVSYEDEQSILEKGKYAEAMGLGGAIVWTINQGFLANKPAGMQDPLMEALGQAFLK